MSMLIIRHKVAIPAVASRVSIPTPQCIRGWFEQSAGASFRDDKTKSSIIFDTTDTIRPRICDLRRP